MKLIVIGFIILFSVIIVSGSVFIVTEGQLAIITELGKPIREPLINAGLYFKIPFFQEVRYVDKRILTWDGFPSEIPTKDKKYIKVDTTARWRVIDALKFIQTVRNERGAKARLDAILDATTRDVISNNNLVEAVRNSNQIVKNIEDAKREIEAKKARGEAVVEEISGEIEKVTIGREKLSEIIARDAGKELESFGIKIIDVQFRRISYEKSVENKVYERMISERQKIAQKIRSIGQGERAKIEGRVTKDLQGIESEAYKDAQVIRGNGEAKAFKIYAKALSFDPEFYSFVRSLEAYRKSIGSKTKFILSQDAEFLRYLKRTK